jgi:DNA-binding NarL/FixJ family response regulator
MRVLLVEPHKLFAEAIQLYLERQGICVSVIATSGESGTRAASVERFDLVVIDLNLPDLDALSAATIIRARCPAAKILGLGRSSEFPPGIAGGLDWDGFVNTDALLSDLVQFIREVRDGSVAVTRPPGRRIAGKPSLPVGQERGVVDHLTAREKQVLTLLAMGSGGNHIARTLAVSPNTVRSHIQNILTKLQVHSRLEAVVLAVRHGIVDTREADSA